MSKTDVGGVPLVIFHTAKREPAEVHNVLDAASWFDFFKWVTIAYILSRGIAKASRVLEQ